MQKVVVFGDSYAVSGNTENYSFQKTWVDLLSKDYIIENYSEIGCGPDLQLEKFINYFTNDCSNDVIIFVLPHHLRLSLTGLQPVEHVYSFVYLHDKVKGIGQKIKDRLKSLQQSNRNDSYEQYKKANGEFLDLWYEKFLRSNTYLETEPLKICSLISKYRKYSKKIILVPVHPFTNKDRQLLIEDNFYITDISLRLLDEGENLDVDIIIKNNGIDPRPGHLGPANHIKVYNQLKEIIDGKIYS